MSSYEVLCYHVNVGVGDGAIYLLMEDDKLLRSVLIDGGFPGVGWLQLEAVIKIIENWVEFAEAGVTTLRFDAIIITHWDGDHYGGVFDMITNTLLGEIKRDPNAALADIMCPRMKYGVNRKGKPDKLQPLTTLYTPNWKPRNKLSGAPNYAQAADGSPILLNYNVDMSKGTPTWVPGICKVKYGPDQVIGCEVFFGSDAVLATAVGLAGTLKGGMPGMFIVAAMEEVISSTKSMRRPLQDTEDTGLRTDTGVARGLGDPEIINQREKSITNRSSIATVVLWKKGRRTPRVSHLTAGDAGFEVEIGIIDWLFGSDGGGPIGSIKLSHHGAAVSTPHDFFTRCTPRSLIVSSGTDHYHPRWELLLFLDLYYRGVENTPAKRNLYPTCYPYWLKFIREDASTNSRKRKPPTREWVMWQSDEPNFKALEAAGPNAPETAYQELLTDYVGRINDGTSTEEEDPTEIYQTEMSGSSRTEQIDWLYSKIEALWTSISAVTSAENPYPSSTNLTREGLAVVSPSQRIQYIYVQLSDDNNDGAAQSITAKGAELIWYRGNVSANRRAKLKQETDPEFIRAGRYPETRGKKAASVNPKADATSQLHGASSAVPTPPASPKLTAVSARQQLRLPSHRPYQECRSHAVEPGKAATTAAKPNPGFVDPANAFFIASSIAFPKKSDGPNIHVVPTDEPISLFLCWTHHGYVKLQQKPSKDAVLFAPDDELFQWLSDPQVLWVSHVYLHPQMGTQDIAFLSIQFTVPTLLTRGDAWTLNFTSEIESNRAMFSLNTPISQYMDHTGYVTYGGMLVFSLKQPDGMKLVNVGNVFSVFGVDTGLLVGLLDDVQLKLDTSPGARSAVFLFPELQYETTLRLKFSAANNANRAKIQKYINIFLNKIKVTDASVIGRKSVTSSACSLDNFAVVESSVTLQVIATLDDALMASLQVEPSRRPQMTFDVLFAPKVIQFIVNFDKNSGTMSEAFKWLGAMLPPELAAVESEIMSFFPLGHTNTLIVRRITAAMEMRGSSGWKLVSADIELEVLLSFGTDPSGLQACFTMSYLFPKSSFVGALWTQLPESTPGLEEYYVPPELYPAYEPYLDFRPFTQQVNTSLSLSHLDPEGHLAANPQPTGVGTQLLNVTIELDKEPSPRVSFEAIIICTKPQAGTYNVPAIVVDTVRLAASYKWPVDGNSSQLTCSLAASIDLIARTDPQTKQPLFPTAVLAASIDFASQTGWTLTGTVYNLNMGLLYSFFDDGADALMNIMEKIVISSLYLTYNYDKASGNASTFDFLGTILLGSDPVTDAGGLALELHYQHFGNDSSSSKRFSSTPTTAWKLWAELAPHTKGSSTVRSVVRSVVGDHVAGELPDFVGNIPVAANTTTTSKVTTDLQPSPTSTAVSLNMSTSVKDPNLFIFEVRISIEGNFAITFVQLSKKNAKAAEEPKRIVKLSASPMGAVGGFPLIGSAPQPFDELDFVWVHDKSADGGLLRSEIAEINAAVFEANGIPGLLYVETSKDPQVDAKLPVLKSGSHFIVIVDGVAKLDYPLFTSPSPEQFSDSSSGHIAMAAVQGKDQNDSLDDESKNLPQDAHVAVVGKQFGPLNIQNLGLKYESGVLSILMTATFQLGPIELALLGFGIGVRLSGVNLYDPLPIDALVPQLSGLAISFSQPPLALTGIFDRISDDSFMGGITMNMEPYSFLAVGAYSTETIKTEAYKSLFVFLQADGPLIELEFATLTGVKAGFGYNSSLMFPTLNNIQQFPMIGNNMSDPGKNPLDVLLKLCNQSTGSWVTPQDGPIWLAAGLSITAFGCLSADAVVALEFDPIKLGIFAEIVAALPENEPPQQCFIYAELAMICTVEFDHGSMITEGQLTPNSFVLAPACHLFGGFAFAHWFGDNPHSGDWVFSIGGYHARYKRPDHYPSPARLGIYWSLDSCLSVTGEAYFAITPKAAMGGGLLKAAFSLGPLGAWFDAWADFLFNFSPFHFIADIGVDVGVSFTLDLWICTIHISVSLGANLHLEGTPIGGVVTVEFYLFSFDIHFGDLPQSRKPLKLQDFYILLARQDPVSISMSSSSLQARDTSAGKDTITHSDTVPTFDDAHIFVVEDGLAASNAGGKSLEKKPGQIWNVKAGKFKFRVQSKFAIMSASTGNEISVTEPTAISSKQMHLDQPILQSHLDIAIALPNEKLRPFRITKVLNAVPASIWGPYDPRKDPNADSPDTSDLLDGTTAPCISLMTGIAVSAPNPTVSVNNLTYNAENTTEPIFTAECTPLVAPSLPAQKLWTPQASRIDPSVPTAQWDDVMKAWSSPTGGPVADMLTTWQQLLGWTVPKIDALDTAVPVGLLKPAEFYNYLESPVLGQDDVGV